ncbi:GGDEF domain-containing protein [Halioxenophilus sp. WMMB6]|uniref:GGDEF domain-containing protein n=1 Tax=Halioxenophilus sp. WMMB6 TaxID=3073815 RepID=UPI00295E8B98|nr:GGDEF domain-containing protein [Halioxenophilus sp. WMMB6]
MAASWRDKYLQALADQENSDKRSQSQIAQLRSCLQALSEVALGADPELDDLLTELVGGGKNRTPRSVNTDQIAKAAKKVKERKPTRVAVSQEALEALVEALIRLNPNHKLQAELKHYGKLLSRRVSNQHAYPQLLREIAELHRKVLNDIVVGRPSWMARMMGHKAQIKDESAESLQTVAVVNETASEMRASLSEAPGSVVANEPPAPGDPIEAEFLVLDEPYGAEEDDTDTAAISSDEFKPSITPRPLGDQPEPKFSSIGDKVTRILEEMLDGVVVDSCVRQKFVDAKARIDAGLNWYELVATLEDVRDLFLQAYLVSHREFADYLQQVDQALLEIKQAWTNLVSKSDQQRLTQVQIGQELSRQQEQLQQELASTQEIDQLKSAVAGHIKELASTLTVVHQAELRQGDQTKALAAMQAQLDALQQRHQQLQAELEQQHLSALHDPITGLPNRDAYNQKVHEELLRWRRYQRPVSLAVVDIDHFKQFNDNYGQPTGDRVLKIIGKILRQRLREVDFIARFGSEEFVLVLPETDIHSAAQVLDTIRRALAQAPFKFKEEPVSLTASFGLTQLRTDDTAESAFARADKALDEAKAQGRNRIVLG